MTSRLRHPRRVASRLRINPCEAISAHFFFPSRCNVNSAAFFFIGRVAFPALCFFPTASQGCLGCFPSEHFSLVSSVFRRYIFLLSPVFFLFRVNHVPALWIPRFLVGGWGLVVGVVGGWLGWGWVFDFGPRLSRRRFAKLQFPPSGCSALILLLFFELPPLHLSNQLGSTLPCCWIASQFLLPQYAIFAHSPPFSGIKCPGSLPSYEVIVPSSRSPSTPALTRPTIFTRIYSPSTCSEGPEGGGELLHPSDLSES